jgi:hypothetical protein
LSLIYSNNTLNIIEFTLEQGLDLGSRANGVARNAVLVVGNHPASIVTVVQMRFENADTEAGQFGTA